MAAGEIPVSIERENELPAERFRDWTDVFNLADQFIDADRRRNIRRANVERLFNRNPTYRMQYLKNKGQAWRSRVNYGGLEGVCNTMETAIYNLDVEVNSCVDIGLDFGKGVEKRDWEEKIARNFSWMMLKAWKGFDDNSQLRIHEMILHGMGYHTRPNKDHWIPYTPQSGCVLFPEDCPTTFREDGEFMMIRDFRTGTQIYDYIRNEAAAEKLGWKVENVWKFLAISSKAGGEQNENDPVQFARNFKQGDIGYSNVRRSGGWLDFVYVKEFDEIDGKQISLYVVGEKQDVGGYLFKKRYLMEDWPVWLFPYDIGNGTIQSIQGAGARMEDFFQLQNRIYNAMTDQVLVGATMPVKQTSQTIDPEKLKLMKVGLFSIIPQGLEPVTGFAYPPLGNGPVALANILKGNNAENNQTYMPQQPEAKDRQTGMEYSMRSQDLSMVSKGKHNLYYRKLSDWYESTLLLALKPQTGNSQSAVLARKMQQKCIDQGVPKEAFDHIEEVTAVRSVGAGSAAARLNAFQTIMQYIWPNTTDDRRISIERDLTSTLVGYDLTDRYARSQDDNQAPNNDESFATTESDLLTMGGQALAASGQNHVLHAQMHMKRGGELQQAIEGRQMAPDQGYSSLRNLISHVNDHLKFLSTNPMLKGQYAELQKSLNELVQYAKHLAAIIQQVKDSGKQPTPEEQLSEDGKIKMAKVQQDAAIKKFKADQDEQRKWQKFFGHEKRSDAGTAADILRKQPQNGNGMGIAA